MLYDIILCTIVYDIVASGRACFGERFKWVKSEQQLPGIFQKNTKKIKLGIFFWGGEQKFREVLL